MLDALDEEIGIENDQMFSEYLLHCFTAKNTMSRNRGYSPELHVLGKCGSFRLRFPVISIPRLMN